MHLHMSGDTHTQENSAASHTYILVGVGENVTCTNMDTKAGHQRTEIFPHRGEIHHMYTTVRTWSHTYRHERKDHAYKCIATYKQWQGM